MVSWKDKNIVKYGIILRKKTDWWTFLVAWTFPLFMDHENAV